MEVVVEIEETNVLMEDVVVEIEENNVPMEDEALAVRVCRVPKSFSSIKPEAFTPQFVGLGPYHHSNEKLIFTENFKLDVAKRIFHVSVLLTPNSDQNFISSDIVEALFHSDVRSTYDPPHRLVYSLTLDALFLLALLYNANNNLDPPQQHFSSCYILTGRKRGMPLVNASGAKLTMDAIVRDVLMLENQIPTQVLKPVCRRVIKMNQENEEHDKDLGLTMLKFCQALSPLPDSHPLSKDPQSHDHLLDLMYHMVASMPDEPQPPPQSPPQPLPSWREVACILPLMFCLLVLIIGFIILIILLIILYTLVCIGYLFGFLMINIMRAAQSVLLKVPILGAIIPQLKMEYPSWSDFWSSFNVETFSHILPLWPQAYELIEAKSLEEYLTREELVTIPSATQLHSANFRFKPVKGGISWIGFDARKKEFSLPCLKLGDVSEVIIRNLVAYESLTKSADSFYFANYIEIMSSLIHTAEDAQLLIDNKIIHTHLSPDFVAQLFKGLMPCTNVIRRITDPRMRNLALISLLIKIKFDAFHTLKLFQKQVLLSFVIFLILFLFYPLLFEAVRQLYLNTIFPILFELLFWSHIIHKDIAPA